MLKKSHLYAILAIAIIVLAIPLIADSHMAMAKKHVGPVPFPPDIIPSVAKHIGKNHDVISHKP